MNVPPHSENLPRIIEDVDHDLLRISIELKTTKTHWTESYDSQPKILCQHKTYRCRS